MNLDCTQRRPRLDLDDPGLRLTAAQRQAMAIDRELVVTAGAGAGKTYALSLRYLALLLELSAAAVEANPQRPRPDIEAVLVLTFTEKAAEEMGERCYRRLLTLAEAIRSPGATQQSLARAYGDAYPLQLGAAVEHLVDHFDRARIGTFHGFCARILTEFPSQTHTPPGFTVLDETESSALLNDSIEAQLRVAYRQKHAELLPLIAAFGSHRALTDALKSALANRDLLGGVLTRYQAGSVTLADLFDLFPHPPADLLTWLIRTGVPMLAQIQVLASPAGGGKHLTTVVIPALNLAEGVIAQADPSAVDIARAYTAVLQSLCTSAGSVRSLGHHGFVGRKGGWDNNAYAAAVLDLKGLIDDVADWPGRLSLAQCLPNAVDAAMLRVLPLFADLVLRARDDLNSAFDQLAAVDFSALQERAVDAVLSHPDLRAELCRRHRYLMVDEFQDTDERQWAMVRALGRPDDRPSDRIFVVGDVKQAIYRFRGGDVTVFRAATDELGVAPVVFPDNFRSRDRLIEWFNAFFASAMGAPSAQRPAFEAGYDALTPAREEPGGSVSLSMYESAKNALADATAEADATARLIAGQFLATDGPYSDLKLADSARHPTPPIAILLRSRTRLASFEAALRTHGVPFIVTKGVGFWSKAEVVDVVNLLHAIATDDPISVVGALRSPLLGLSDLDLQALRELNDLGFEQFYRLKLAPDLPPPVHRAQQILRALRQVRHQVSLPDLIQAALVQTQAEHAYALLDDGGQAAANVQRLTEIAGAQAHHGLDAFVRYALDQVDGDTRDSEALIPPSTARVVIMTVHASKGLEFPVVVVPGCGQRPRANSASLAYGRLNGTWQIASRALDPNNEVRQRAHSGLLDLLAWTENLESRAESKRLLYVACTRARDHLVLLGAEPKDGFDQDNPKTWTEMFASAMDLADPPASLTLCDLNDWLAIEPNLRLERPAPPPPTADAQERLAALPAPSMIEVSPSSLDRFATDAKAWYRRDRLGVRDSTPSSVTMGLSLAGARGEVIHSLLEDDVAHDHTTARARWQAQATLVGADTAAIDAGWPVLVAHLERTSADPRVQERLLAPGMPEVRFRLAHAGVVLVGQIDRLWRDSEGRWVVLDWKSEQVRGSAQAAAQRHARQLLAYAWAANQVLRARGAGQVHRAEVYFTATAELVAFPAFTQDDFANFEADLRKVARIGSMTWDQVLA